MARFLCLFAILVNLSIIQCYVKLSLQSRPAPMPNFVPEKLAGRWYYQAQFVSCNWSGSKRFTNFVRQYDVTDDAIAVKSTYRSGPRCTSITDVRKLSKTNCAVQTTSDNIGDIYSGESIILCSDYKRYLIYWGCLKYNLSNPKKCDDPSLSVQTRDVQPSPNVWKIIDKKLYEILNLKVADLDRMVHDNPC